MVVVVVVVVAVVVVVVVAAVAAGVVFLIGYSDLFLNMVLYFYWWVIYSVSILRYISNF